MSGRLADAQLREVRESHRETHDEYKMATELLALRIAHDDLVAALKEAHLQLVYLDSQFSTGTTPAVLARIHNALAKAAQS